MSRRFLTAVSLIVTALTACTYDRPEEIACSTANTNYSGTIVAILQNNKCLDCHGTIPTSGAPFSLVGHANVKAVVTAGRLLGAINHESGFAPMPQGLPKMSQCDIEKVKAWVAAGAPNN